MRIQNRERTSFVAAALLAIALPAFAQGRGTPTPQPVTVIGCLTRNGAVEHDKGTRELNTEPNGFALTGARITSTGNARSSAVPGSAPSGSNTGTIQDRDTVVGRQATPDATTTTGFALEGKDLRGLSDLVGRRVEVVGTLTTIGATPKTEVDQPRGTSGTDRATTTVVQPESGTREERPASESAHPSADLQRLAVSSFRGVTGVCE